MDSSSDSDEFYECDDDSSDDVVEAKKEQPKDKITDSKHINSQVNNNDTDNEIRVGEISPDTVHTVPQRPLPQEINATDGSRNNNEEKVQKRPEFGIPPRRVTCWFPEVDGVEKDFKPMSDKTSTIDNAKVDENNDISNDNENVELLTAKVEECKISQEDDEESTQTIESEEKHAISESPVNSQQAEKHQCITTDNSIIKDTKSDIIDAACTTETDRLKKDEIRASKLPVEDEDDLWNTEDDWGKMSDTKDLKESPKMDEEENLWGDGDGWDLDTPMDTPKKESSKPEPQMTDDLWAEGDTWEVDDPPNQPAPIQSAFASLTNREDSTWGGWSNWGISSVLSTAANITTQVSQGLTNVLETGIGVPEPEALARLDRAEETVDQPNTEQPSHSEPSIPFGLSNLVSGVSTITKLVETTGSKVITGGLGTLETIGKKTYQVLQENDPQLKRKRAFLRQFEGDKPVLSQILREAKDRAEDENRDRERRHFAKKANYETMFDDYKGLVHLEALEMLSKQCEIKLEITMEQASDVNEMQETMEQIKDLCELNTDEEEDDASYEQLKERINSAIADINIGITCETLLGTFEEILASTENKNAGEIHATAIENLAKITALAVEQYHKAGELLLVKEHRSTADEADSLVQLTMATCGLITILSTRYSNKLKETASSDGQIKDFISNIFLEAANSSRYIEDAFHLLLPVIQIGAV